MGLSASQMRFLMLTGRKTDVEFQGQQINQKRTILAQESQGVMNTLITLNPPAVTSFASSADDATQDWDPAHAWVDDNNSYYSVFTEGNGFNTTYTPGENDMNDQYEEALAEYNAKINWANTKIEEIHAQDRVLEMQLKNLDTQQQAIQTEMDAVKKVIDKNIDLTFKTFA